MSHGCPRGRSGPSVGILVLAVVGLTAVAGTSRAWAQDAGPNTGKISVSAGFDIVSQYWFRGLAQENQGFIMQPWMEIGLSLYEGDESSPIDSVGIAFGIWNSFHDGPSGSGDQPAGTATVDPESWYEADWYAGVSIGLFDDFEVGATFTAYTSPNDWFATTKEIAVGFAYDDSGLWESAGLSVPGFEGLQPSFTVAFETDGGADNGTSLGTYYEFAFGPSFTLIDSEDMPVTLSMPFTFGFGSDYYEDGTGDDDAFGYFDFGVDLSTDLTFIPADYGAWSTYFGVHVIALGDTAQTIAGPNGFNVTTGDSAEVYVKFGISMEY